MRIDSLTPMSLLLRSMAGQEKTAILRAGQVLGGGLWRGALAPALRFTADHPLAALGITGSSAAATGLAHSGVKAYLDELQKARQYRNLPSIRGGLF